MASSQFEFPYDGFGAPSFSNPESGLADQAKARSVAVDARKPFNRASERPEHEAKARSRAAGTKAHSEAELPDPQPLDMRGEFAREQYLSVRNVALRYDCSVPTIWRWVGQRTGFPSPVRLSPGCTRWRLSDLLHFEQQSRGGRK